MTPKQITIMAHPALEGTLPGIGSKAPELRYVKQDRSEGSLTDHAGEVVILLTYPSVDTSTCALETRTFNKLAADLGAHVLIVSMDLPFAFKRFCAAEGIDKLMTGSDFRYRDAGGKWGARIAEGSMNGTLGRITWVIDRDGVVRYCEVAKELSAEPDYDAAISAAKELL